VASLVRLAAGGKLVNGLRPGIEGGRLMKKVFLCALALCAVACSKSDAGGAAPRDDSSVYGENGEGASQQQFAMVGQPGQGAPRGAPRNYMRFERGVIVDPVGFAQPTAVSSLFVPYGWRSEGGVFWGQQFMCTNGYNFEWRATAPDGSSGVMVLPQAKWENNSYGAASSSPGCQAAPYTTARAWIEALAGRYFQGARVVDYRDRPDLVAQIGAAPQRQQMPMGESRSWTEAGEALIAFQQNGVDMRGTIAAAVQFNLMITDMSQVGGNNMQALTAFAHPGWAAYAPNGRFSFGYFEAIRRSIQPNPQWWSAITNHNLKIGQVAIEEGRKRAAMIAQSNEEISRIRQAAWDNQQKSADLRAREFGELMKGVETYSDADAPGGTVELSRTDHAWRLNDGSYILTDDPNFEPWRDLQLEGRRLEAVQ
jgi:hypothetical protein